MSWRLALGLLALLQAATAAAQSESADDRDNWYRVELLVFANRDPDAARIENWPLLPDLAYPDQWYALRRGSLLAPADPEYTFESIEERVSGPINLYWDRSLDSLWREWQDKQARRFEDSQLVSLSLPRQRTLLPAEMRELNAQRNRIDASANLGVLFHQTWLQRIDERERSIPVIVESPVRFGDYPELQGSILLYSSRYLHLATDLWLNTGGRYLDDDPRTTGWTMPPPPPPVEGDQSLLLPLRVDVDPGSLQPPQDRVKPDTARETGAVEEAPAAAIAQGEAVAADSGEEPGPKPATVEELRALLKKPAADYEFRHAVLVKQRRRMRSGELHYIDHPLLGLVIKITRYEFEPFFPLSETAEPPGTR